MEHFLSEVLANTELMDVLKYLHRLTGMSADIVNKEGEVLLSIGQNTLCHQLVGCNDAAAAFCREDRAGLLGGAAEGGVILRRCRNGSFHAALPIFIDNEQVASLVLYHFTMEDITPTPAHDYARATGLNEAEYTAALKRMRCLGKDQVDDYLELFRHFTALIADMSTRLLQSAQIQSVMQESINFYGSLMQNNSAVLLLVDVDSVEIFDASTGAAGFYGYQPEDLRGMPLASVMPTGARDLAAMLRESSQDMVFHHRTRHRLHSGETREVELQLTPLELQGRALVLIIVQDITRQLAAEEERRQTELRLQHAQKLEALGTLASGIAHDFNNILSAMMGYAEFSKLQLDQASHVQNNLDEILKAGNRAKDLVNQILTFSHQVQTNPRPIELAGIVKEALKLLRITIPTTIEFRKRISPQAGRIIADPVQIHQILMNLCTNAYHAMHPNGGVMSVTVEPVRIDDDFRARFPNLTRSTHSFVRLTVSDTGQGMDSATMARIFDPFFTTKREGKGTGLGLATVYGIVVDLEGCIEVHSKPGEGARFDIYLPQAQLTAEEAEKGPEAMVRGNGEHILLIDDEESIIAIGKLMLERLGYRVTATVRPYEALDLFTSGPNDFEAVITDFAMPGIHGFELAERVRSLKPGTPVFMITGYSDDLADDFTDHQVQKILRKPIDWKLISRLIQQYRYVP